MGKQLFIILIIIGSTLQGFGQQRCATVEYQKIIDPHYELKNTRFENWISRQQVRPTVKSFRTHGTSSATYVIPVVFHVIHNGEPIGTGTNISDAQLISQIHVLNKDFQRLNADASQTPAEFLSVAGNLDIEFVLAKQDPEGLATNGIRRVQGTKTEWTVADRAVFESLSYWPSEDYLNIWIINLNDPGGYIGYAQFPESPLPGLEGSSSDPLTDGIVLNYRDVGSVDDEPTPGVFNLEPQFNKGRTATHEMGHFLGLRHIWGDNSGCIVTGDGSDYVDDTPVQSTSTTGCPGHPQVSCSNNKMFQNFLDYTNDACMNLFTAGQVTRMEIILQNSPRRVSLTSSVGSQPPAPVANDLGLKRILNPGTTSCGGTVTPSIEVRNYGTNVITSARIAFALNGNSQEVKDVALSLNPLDVTTIDFNAITLASPSSTLVSFQIIQTNGGIDGKVSDDLMSHTATVPFISNVPFFEHFNSTPTDWVIQNPDNLKTWQNVPAINGEPGNNAMYINYHSYEEKGVEDRLFSPILNLDGSQNNLFINFDWAYAPFPSSSLQDELRVLIINNCNSDLSSGIEIFRESGQDLATATATSNSFIPSSKSQWSTFSKSLSAFVGTGDIQFVFIGKNGYGNNLYLDNVFVTDVELGVALTDIISPSPVINKNNFSPIVTVTNEGSNPLTQVSVETKVNGVISSSKLFNQLMLSMGESIELTLDPVVLRTGANELAFTLSAPNGGADETPFNNSKTRTVIMNQSAETIPARQNFNLSFQDTWTIVSQANMLNWELTTTNKGTSLVYRAFSNTSKGDEAWLVSPVLDFSKSVKASLFFDVSYALGTKGTERLRLLSSTDGGLTFKPTQFDKTGNELTLKSSPSEWKPANDTDWMTPKIFVNLNDLVGEENVRLAFVATNDNGNNLYLDEIELYNDDNPFPPVTTSLYRIYTTSSNELKITFNLSEKETSRLQVYNMMGQLVLDNLLPDNLNQTYTLDMSTQRTGIYILKLQVANQIESTKVFITR